MESSVIGPHTTVEAGCKILGSVIQNSIIEKGSQVEDALLNGSLIGQNTVVKGGSISINVGDDTVLEI